MELKLSVLDQLPIPKGQPTREALLASLELAKLADSLGYHRFWFAEHHNTRDLASVAPELLISHTAAQTSQIRVGSGGVLLSHYSPYKVAENFRLLEGLYPNRIDLGTRRDQGRCSNRSSVSEWCGAKSVGIPETGSRVAFLFVEWSNGVFSLSGTTRLSPN